MVRVKEFPEGMMQSIKTYFVQHEKVPILLFCQIFSNIESFLSHLNNSFLILSLSSILKVTSKRYLPPVNLKISSFSSGGFVKSFSWLGVRKHETIVTFSRCLTG